MHMLNSSWCYLFNNRNCFKISCEKRLSFDGRGQDLSEIVEKGEEKDVSKKVSCGKQQVYSGIPCYETEDRAGPPRPTRSQLRLGHDRDWLKVATIFSITTFGIFVDKTKAKTRTIKRKTTKTDTRSLTSRLKGERGVRETHVKEEDRDGGTRDGVSSRDANGGDTHRTAGLPHDHTGPQSAEEPRLLHRWRFLDRRLRAPHVHATHTAYSARRRQGKAAYFLCLKVNAAITRSPWSLVDLRGFFMHFRRVRISEKKLMIEFTK